MSTLTAMTVLGVAGIQDMLEVALALVIAVPLVVLVYHAMQRPRLRLVRTDEGWRTTRRDAALYVLSITVLLALWWAFFALILFVTASNLDALAVITVAAGVVMGVRVLAHARVEWAHELAKAVPLTLIVVGLITRSIRSMGDLIHVASDLNRVQVSAAAWPTLIAVDLLATAVWYFLGVRYLWSRGWAVPGVPSIEGLSSARRDSVTQ